MEDNKVVKKPEPPVKRICKMCSKPLRKIGLERKNGKKIYNKTGLDWHNREYHKKCYALLP